MSVWTLRVQSETERRPLLSRTTLTARLTLNLTVICRVFCTKCIAIYLKTTIAYIIIIIVMIIIIIITQH